MKVHITNINGQHYRSVAQIAQNMVAKIARDNFHWNEISIFNYNMDGETPDQQVIRFDGMIAGLSWGDIVVVQSPSWNQFEFDVNLLQRIKQYQGVKIAMFVHDVIPLMFKVSRDLMGATIDYYNEADLLILPTPQMYHELRKHGLKEKKVVYQYFWDHVGHVDPTVAPQYQPMISFIGDVEKFDFVKNWDNDDVKLLLTSDAADWGANKNIEFVGWQDDPQLLALMHKRGGFGLLWGEEPYWREYMKLNASYKLSTYLAAGIPVLVGPDTPQRDVIERKGLGLIVDSLDDAAAKVAATTPEEYNKMVENVREFSKLILQGYFTKRLLSEAVFKLLYD